MPLDFASACQGSACTPTMLTTSATPMTPTLTPKLTPNKLQGTNIAQEILTLIMRFRRQSTADSQCASTGCPTCLAPHLGRVLDAVNKHLPVEFVLPAFPGKSPNPAKVLGPLPDMAERQSLLFLNQVCRRIRDIYEPGARIIVCSDGRVFNDVVGIAEKDITDYQHGLTQMIKEVGAEYLATFNLDEILQSHTFDEMRSHLMNKYGEPIEFIQSEVRAGGDAVYLYRGITRFLLDDAWHPNILISKSQLQKECRRRAYQVMQRSRAWDRLIAEFFPGAVRLSIHPQRCGSRKIGIHLMETTDEWLTPWHGVAVDIRGRFRLMKRQQVESMNATLVYRTGQPSHFVTPPWVAKELGR